MKDLPIIDLSQFRNGDAATRAAVAEKVDQACRDIGFIVLTGHGIPKDVFDAGHRIAGEFFALPLETKTQYERVGESFYGYYQMESSALAYTLDAEDVSPDLREAFASNRPDIETGDPYFRSDAVKNLGYLIQYPQEVERFQETWTDTYYALAELGRDIMSMFAAALKQPPDYFENLLARHASNLAVFTYPPLKGPVKDGQLRCGAHTDYGSLTIVHSDWSIPGGLQILSPSGEWIDAPNVENSVVINIGDMMQRWTNDRWVSTMHRVGNPDDADPEATHRQSLVFFYNPDMEGLVEAIPSCVDADNPSKYKPIIVADHFLTKMGKMIEET
ncbi:MAG: 2-oxoglutarate and iron-dependent oxygenase domain-containing protein [Pseudomonadota bacterium]